MTHCQSDRSPILSVNVYVCYSINNELCHLLEILKRRYGKITKFNFKKICFHNFVWNVIHDTLMSNFYSIILGVCFYLHEVCSKFEYHFGVYWDIQGYASDNNYLHFFSHFCPQLQILYNHLSYHTIQHTLWEFYYETEAK